jgi:hypothetical protein
MRAFSAANLRLESKVEFEPLGTTMAVSPVLPGASEQAVESLGNEVDLSDFSPVKYQRNIIFTFEQVENFSNKQIQEINSSVSYVYNYCKQKYGNVDVYIVAPYKTQFSLSLYNGDPKQIPEILKLPTAPYISLDYVTAINDIYDLTEDSTDSVTETYIFSIIGNLENSVSDTKVALGLRRKFNSDDRNIHLSIISDNIEPPEISFAMSIIKKTEGALIDFYGNESPAKISFGEEVIEYIFSDSTFTANEFKIISALDLNVIRLDSPISYDMYSAHMKKKSNSDIDYSIFSDTDKDSLYDFEEIDFESGLMEFDLYDVVLPTIAQCEAHVNKPYVRLSFEKIRESYEANGNDFDNIRILPIVSHPCNQDGDWDGRYDNIDKNPLINYPLVNYSREDAITYAERWYNVGFNIEGNTIRQLSPFGLNPDFYYYNTDCANFVSQCLYAGGYRMYGIGRNDGWHSYHVISNSTFSLAYEVSSTWSLAVDQYEYFAESDYCTSIIRITSEIVSSDEKLNNLVNNQGIQKGDLLMMDFEGDGIIDHSTIINDVTDTLLYAGHTKNRFNKDFRTAWEDNPDCVMYVICLGN